MGRSGWSTNSRIGPEIRPVEPAPGHSGGGKTTRPATREKVSHSTLDDGWSADNDIRKNKTAVKH